MMDFFCVRKYISLFSATGELHFVGETICIVFGGNPLKILSLKLDNINQNKFMIG